MDTTKISTQELTVLREALSDYTVRMRSVWTSPTESRVVSEMDFLTMDISDKRRENYHTSADLLEAVRAELLKRH